MHYSDHTNYHICDICFLKIINLSLRSPTKQETRELITQYSCEIQSVLDAGSAKFSSNTWAQIKAASGKNH